MNEGMLGDADERIVGITVTTEQIVAAVGEVIAAHKVPSATPHVDHTTLLSILVAAGQ